MFEYCEALTRGSPVQPLNMASSVPFLILAWMSWRHLAGDQGVWFLAVAGWTGTGLGSLGWHATLMPGFLALDVCGIALIAAALIRAVLLRRATARGGSGLVSARAVIGSALALGAMSAPFGWFSPQAWQMAPAFGPAALLLAALAFIPILVPTKPGERILLAGAAVALTVAIAARAADVPVCAAWPWGLHPVWHLLAGSAGWLGLTALRAR